MRRVYHELGLIVRALTCALDGHGPFALPVASSSFTPPLYCLTCGADCSHIVKLEVLGGRLVLWNLRADPAIVVTWTEDRAVIPPRHRVIYYRGRFET